ncbi:hypothetical protein Q648_00088 [Bartonella quintana JK 12]|uniref:Uncharacterized protein n=2 Tax=Bartonella quintana TaxID=803 RepID=W3TYF5_BARQI|nr:hypothetical protein Q651_00416 [Bartonella quintana BQ2-D70]ETS13881.1 hypothetical protein Q650_00497 [Bartonella quintana JK 73rel]ETS15568.1 hypothetical protein Q649_00506 [Bartonella quintana JK 73]ETS17573.1 hypothetical protein Q647_00497 [Bartonella quintana JK 7]ETS18404.1 hypothetical protein Q648_00088 [Bartonella quintana JK 12]KEC59414.1 hypothetical protein O93_00745 [Bartonella quintana JK 19]KEC62477.1 hypothetical protein O7Y_00514 [Bartonella quintana JK 63]KEC63664.1 h
MKRTIQNFFFEPNFCMMDYKDVRDLSIFIEETFRIELV